MPDTHIDPSRFLTGRFGAVGFRLYLLLSTAIALAVCLYYAFDGKVFAFTDIGLDSFSYYYPMQVVHARQFAEYHTLTWSFQFGLGGYVGSMVSIPQFLMAMLPESWQLEARLPYYLAKLLIAGAFFFGYLQRLRFEPRLACIGALCYAFGNYGAINEQWDSLVIVQFAAYLYFFESYLRTAKAPFAVAAGITVCIAGSFELYLFALLTVLYVPARALLVETRAAPRALLPALLRYAGWAALGALLLAILQVPSLLVLLDSPRVSGDHAKFGSVWSVMQSLNDVNTIAMQIAGLFGKDLLGTNMGYYRPSNYFEGPGFYSGMLMLVCATQLASPHATRKERASLVVAGVLLSLYIVWPAMRQVVYGFGHVGFRISTLWVSAGIVVIGLAGLRRTVASGVWRPGLAISAFGILAGLVFAWAQLRDWIQPGHLLLVLATCGIYAGGFWILGKRRISPTLLSGLAVLVAVELFVFAMPAWMGRIAVGSDGSSSRGSYDDGTREAIAFVRSMERSNDFYRIEKTYESIFLNDPLVQGYEGTSSYAFHGRSITRFVDELGLTRRSPRANYISPMVDRPQVLDLLGVRYLLARGDRLEGDASMKYLANVGRVRVYRNLQARGVAHLYRELVPESALAAQPPEARDALLLRSLVVEDAAGLQAERDRLDREAGQNHAGGADRARLLKLSDIHLHADVSNRLAMALMIAMPFDRGWSATADGQPVPLFRAQYGLSALLLPPGEHQVDLRYKVPGREVGMLLSLVALALLLASTGWHAWRQRRLD